MKKTLLASTFAVLFTFGTFTAVADNSHGAHNSHKSHQMIKIEHKGDSGSPTVVKLDTDTKQQVFEFTAEELKDMDAVAATLSHLDEKTRTTLLSALSGNLMHHGLDGSVEDQNFVIMKHRDMDCGDGLQMVMGTPGHDGQTLHRIVETLGDDSPTKVFELSIGEEGLHHDSGHAVQVIEKLLKHSVMTQEQLDVIQAVIDAKR